MNRGYMLILMVVVTLKGQLVNSAGKPLAYETNLYKHHQGNHFVYGLVMTPHPGKRQRGGEDAYFVDDNILAVADGVGGWNEHGVDPSRYSRELCYNLKNYWQKDSTLYITKPKEMIIAAAHDSKSKGSSTICMVTLEKTQPRMHSALVGDSSYVIFRVDRESKELKLVFESPEQTKGFNFPYQVGNPGDPPSVAIPNEHEVVDKDVVVVGSDGLFDNLSSEGIRVILQKGLGSDGRIQDMKGLCLELGSSAYKLSLDKNYFSPFAQRAEEQGYRFTGGKSDDITFSVAQIYINPPSANRSEL